MEIQIRPAPMPTGDLLRELVLRSLPTFTESHRIIDAALPGHANAILIIEDPAEPAVISFDAEDPGTALLNGLKCLSELQQHGAWLQRMYPDCPRPLNIAAARLKVLAPRPMPAASCIAPPGSAIIPYTMHALFVNDELRLMVEPQQRESAVSGSRAQRETAKIIERPGTERSTRIVLTEAEESFFGRIA